MTGADRARGAAPAPAGCAMIDAAAIARVGIVDAHAHVFPSAAPGAHPRHPHDAAAIDDLLGLAAQHDVAHVVLTQPSFLGFDNHALLSAAAAAPERVRIVPWLAPGTDPRQLERLATEGPVAGLRFPLHGAEIPDWRSYDALFAVAVARALAVELLVESARLAPCLDALLGRGLTVVVPHLALFDGPAGPARDPGFRAVLAAASTGRVWSKLSAHYGTPAPLAAEAAALLLATLGPERLVWGSDWPHVSARADRRAIYGLHLRRLAAWVPDPAARETILTAAPRVLYRLDRQGACGVAAP